MGRMLVLVLNDEDKLEQILEGFLEIGIRGATVIDSIGMGRILAQNTPFFSNIYTIVNGQNEVNKTVFAVSKHEAKIGKAVAMIREVMDDFKSVDSGLLFVVPVLEAYGFAKPLDDEN